MKNRKQNILMKHQCYADVVVGIGGMGSDIFSRDEKYNKI